ncbi:MAG: hypothetical protein IMZ43_01935 [Thermoplasmata archaeon]|nr:hypothetical protein [Thermoplasmata archaeon]
MPTFERAYIEQELKNIDGNLPAPISLYIIGGGAMSFYDLKTATKDIDVIVTNEKSATTLLTALQKSGYKKIEHVTSVYRRMKTRAVIENNPSKNSITSQFYLLPPKISSFSKQ